MGNGIYKVKNILGELNKYVFDFPVDFKKFDTLTISNDTLEFYREEYGIRNENFEYDIVPALTVLYSRNPVSGCYCRVY